MRIVLDTNVLISGIFFSGPPSRILKAWRNQVFQIALSKEILDEYKLEHREGDFQGINMGLIKVEEI